MAAYWLTYKPLGPKSPRGWPADEVIKLVRRFERDPTNTTTLWRIASHRAQVGDRIYLFKQGSDPRGIFGVGEIVEHPHLQEDSTDIDRKPKYRAKIRFDRLIDPDQGFLLGFDALSDVVPETLITTQSSGVSVAADVVLKLEKRLPAVPSSSIVLDSGQGDDLGFDPDSVNDERERAMRAIRIRRGQPAFRTALLEAYGRRCAITGCAVEDVLEAAHITPYGGRLTNDVSNGLLLRADLHTLFDCGLLVIEPKNRAVVIADALKTSTYARLAGKVLRSPENLSRAPARKNLERRYEIFKARHKIVER